MHGHMNGRTDARTRQQARGVEARAECRADFADGERAVYGTDTHARTRKDGRTRTPTHHATERRTRQPHEPTARPSARSAQVRECRVQNAEAQGTADEECKILCKIPPPSYRGGGYLDTLHSCRADLCTVQKVVQKIFALAHLHSSLKVRFTTVKQGLKMGY